MPKEKSLVSLILEDLLKSKATPLLAPYKFIYRMKYMDPADYVHKIWQMQKRGVISVVERNRQKFIKITRKGELQILLEKAKINSPKNGTGSGAW